MGHGAAAGGVGAGTAAAVLAAAVALAGPAAAGCSPGQVEIRGPAGIARFSVEIADSPEEQSRGLMFRESLASGAGMLFVYDRPERAVFWMKNTLIPLDMVFADATGRVTRVHADARPRDETPIDGGEGVLLVLEINGGLAARLGIGPGAELRHPVLAPGTAAWPCD